jgi:hypothetical protein
MSIVNPLTGRYIKVGGPTYRLLMKGGGNRGRVEGHRNTMYHLLKTPVLRSWMRQKGINKLLPDTLIPASVIMASYCQYGGLSQNQKITDLVHREDLKKYLKTEKLEASTNLPFATLMGRDVFHQFMSQLR